MGEVFFTSDSHFGHLKDFLWQPRGFNSIEEHDEVIIENWNKVVNKDDTVYHLGDVMLNDHFHGINCLSRLNGNIKIIRGNHDTDAKWDLYSSFSNIELLGWATIIKFGKWRFYLSHYPTCIGNHSEIHPKFWNVCGHSHTQNKWMDIQKGQIYHVELDCQNLFPINLEDLKTELQHFNESGFC